MNQSASQPSARPQQASLIGKSVITSVLFGLGLWPIWVALMGAADWVFGDGNIINQLNLLPKKTLLKTLLTDYQQSLLIGVPASLALFLELLIVRKQHRSHLYAGILTALALSATAYWFYRSNLNPVLMTFIAAVLTIVLARTATRILGTTGLTRNRRTTLPMGSTEDNLLSVTTASGVR